MPNIQRDFVWNKKQIINLFDSIYKGYFIGMFWLWRPKRKKELEKLGYWGLPDEYNTNDEQKSRTIEPLKPIGIVDGQQRLSSLSIGLYGSYNGEHLYFNLSNRGDDIKFAFRKRHSHDKKWVKVREIIKPNKKLHQNARSFVRNLKSSIFRFHILDGNISEIADIFEKVNKGGTQLSNSQILLSKVSQEWKDEGRRKFEKLRQDLKKKGLDVDYDFIIKACLFLLDKTVRIKKNSKSHIDDDFIVNINKKWGPIERALKKTAQKVEKLGFDKTCITSYNALIPIAYTFFHKKIDSDEIIKRYLYISFLKKAYGTSPDTKLDKVRSIMKGGSLSNLLKDQSFKITSYDIGDILNYDYVRQKKYTLLALKLLYPSLKRGQDFHQDHMHPSKFFEKEDTLASNLGREGVKNYSRVAKDKIAPWKTLKDRLPNLQFLIGSDNKEKKDTTLAKWAQYNDINRKNNYLGPNVSLKLKNFEQFYNHRKAKMRKKLSEIFIK